MKKNIILAFAALKLDEFGNAVELTENKKYRGELKSAEKGETRETRKTDKKTMIL